MEIKSFSGKFFIYLLIIIFQGGCVSVAHSPYACDSVSERLNLYGWSYRLLGNVTQVGDCAVSKNLKVELGHYYNYYKEKIDWDVHAGAGSMEALGNFGLALDCKKESLGEFKRAAIENKESIFGKHFDRSSREVTKSTLEMIKSSPVLSESCK